jgi:putative ABC transport system permease protein
MACGEASHNRDPASTVEQNMGTLLFDIRDGLRNLRRDRGFAATVILTLGITIGASTAAFSIVNGILLTPLPFPEPGRLVEIREIWKEFADRMPAAPVNERHFEYWRQHNQSFSAVAQYITLPANLTSGGPAAQISMTRTSGTLFDVLRTQPVIGRALKSRDNEPGAPDVVVIGDALWRQRFGGDESILGTAITLDGTPFTVVGVLPPSFRLPSGELLLATVDAFVPLHITAGWAGDHNNLAIGRLADGVTIAATRAELEVLQQQAGEIATREAGTRITLASIVTPLSESVIGRARRGVIILFAAILAVLLIACSNLTNLALTRALSRGRDAALRTALGASRARLLRQAIIDHGILALAGGTLGLSIAAAALRVFVQTAPVDLPRLDEIAIDGRVVAFGFLTTLVTAILVSVLPLWHLGAGDPQAVLRSGSAGAGHAPSGLRARTALTAFQIATTIALLTVTTLLGVSLRRVLDIDYGFHAERVLSVPVALPAARYADDGQRIQIYDRILDAVKSLPGVRAVSSTSLLPMRGEGQVNFVVAAGTNVPRSQQPSANFRLVGPEYFSSLELPVQRGRAFTLADRGEGKPMPAVISQSMAERLWPNDDAVGQTFSRGIDGEAGFEVVGVTADARTTEVERRPPMMVYVPYWWRSRPALSLLVKTDTDPLAVAPGIRRVIDRLDSEIAVGQARPLQQLVDARLAGRRYQARLFVVFGLASLLIATLGVYAVTAYSVSLRRREMNIRVALGAATADVHRLLMTQLAKAVVPGVVFGAAGAMAAGGAAAGLLYEVSPREPLILTGVAASVALIAIVAAIRATRSSLSIDPIAALREE